MSRQLAVSLVALLLIVVLPPTTASDPIDTVPEGLLFRHDADGGRTWQVQIDDDPTGPNLETSVYDQLPPEVRALFLAEVRDFGIYTHPWGSSPLHTTYGFYSVTDTFGLERHPLVIVENEPPGDLASILATKLLEIAIPAADNQLPYALNYVLPTSILLASLGVPGYGPPNDYPVDTTYYRDYPTLYLWTVRKVAAGSAAWQGWYLERTGSAGSTGPTAFAERRIEIGLASRLDAQTDHVAALYLHEDNQRVALLTSSHMEQTFTLGATTQGVDVPLVTVQASDDRSDDEAQYLFYPDSQTTGYAIGITGPDGAFIPLIGTYTESESESMPDGTIPNTRTTSVGVFILGEYEPVLGFRYEGERYPLELWALLWALSGGPGTELSGDWEITGGYFVLGDYRPVLSLRYDDKFAEAHHQYQAMVRVGVYANGYDGPYQALVGVTYDGTLPLVAAALATEAEWLMSAGTFVFETYLPLVGVRYESYRDGQHFSAHEVYEVGVFLGNYDAFVPLLVATWDAHTGSLVWVLGAPDFWGAAGRDADIGVGTSVTGPLAGLQYRTNNPSGYGAKGMVTAGVFLGPSFVPLAGVAHCAPNMGLAGMSPDNEPHFLVGVYVVDTFVPVARARLSDDPNALGVDLLPTNSC